VSSLSSRISAEATWLPGKWRHIHRRLLSSRKCEEDARNSFGDAHLSEGWYPGELDGSTCRYTWYLQGSMSWVRPCRGFMSDPSGERPCNTIVNGFPVRVCRVRMRAVIGGFRLSTFACIEYVHIPGKCQRVSYEVQISLVVEPLPRDRKMEDGPGRPQPSCTTSFGSDSCDMRQARTYSCVTYLCTDWVEVNPEGK
jgi:hypothetical protein